jgi:hypothetical protein
MYISYNLCDKIFSDIWLGLGYGTIFQALDDRSKLWDMRCGSEGEKLQ